ncbi:MAG TPA: hypothetical protein VFY40_28055 [Blastocatellia bacterium]|nr:hypothetical protein [Blastocatellia bacterium]
MLKLRALRFALLATTLAIIVNLALSAVTFAQDKRWRGRVHDKKAEKFINGHDARDGRWDGRGPRFGSRGRRDRDDWFIFRGRRDRGEWRDRWRDDGRRRRRIPRHRRF